jgi:hypothetical protein
MSHPRCHPLLNVLPLLKSTLHSPLKRTDAGAVALRSLQVIHPQVLNTVIGMPHGVQSCRGAMAAAAAACIHALTPAALYWLQAAAIVAQALL